MNNFNKKIIYLAAYKANHPDYNIVYQDINNKRDLAGDMLDVDLTPYDIIIATPPCNYYSKARGNKKPSQYAEDTKHLLPSIFYKLKDIDKPFLIENVRNYKAFKELGLFNFNNIFVQFIGRHTYWSNIYFNGIVEQKYDYRYGGHSLTDNTQGGDNVHNVVEKFIQAALLIDEVKIIL